MKITHAFIASTAFLGGVLALSGGQVSAQSQPSCADTCGYAVVDSSGVVHGVIVCQQGCFGGVMPDEYMGCPPGCALVLQAPRDTNGNVAGIHGPDIVFNPGNNSFERINPIDGEVEWSLESGQPFENAYLRPPTVTQPPAESPVNEQPTQEPAPSVTIPQEPTVNTEAPSGSVAPLSYRNGNAPYVAPAQPTFFSRIFGATSQVKATKAKSVRTNMRPALSVMRIVKF